MRGFLNKMRVFAAVLLIAALAIVPVLDAGCSMEATSAHTESSLATSGDDHGGDKERQHGLCTHNHCHHSGANLLPAGGDADFDAMRQPLLAREQTLPLLAITDGLMRPPRT